MLTATRLNELLEYEAASGIFRWRRSFRHISAGDLAGCSTAYGYWQIKIDGRIYMAHRLAWLYVKGQWPPGILDHRNGDGHCNQFDNLRLCDGTLNNANINKHDRNQSGFKGVYRNGKCATWVARIGYRKKREFLGCFGEAADAERAYDAAAARLFGPFAVTNQQLGLLP